MSIDARTFRKAMGCFPTGVTVVTTLAGEGSPVGVTVSSFTSVSLDPPLVLFCLDARTSNVEAFRRSGHFAINVLRNEQREVSIRFASRMEDKWKGFAYDTWTTGSPILPNCLANIECSTAAIHDGGDHLIFLGRVVSFRTSDTAAEPLLFFRGRYHSVAGPRIDVDAWPLPLHY